MSGFQTLPVSFESGGSRIAGVLYRPAGSDARHPCVVMAHGFSGTMDWILPDFAEVFAAGGLVVLTFDYRHLGSSEGEPRQLIDSRLQREDLRRAIAFARARPDIDADRIALWGTSLGGSHVVEIAAEDPRIAAVVANVPALDMLAGLRGRYRPPHFRPSAAAVLLATARLVAAASVDALRGALGLTPHYIPVYGRLGRAMFSDPALAQRFRDLEDHAPTWRNEVTPRFLFHVPRYRAGTVERIHCPVMATLARDDAELSSAFVRRTVSRARHSEVREYPVGHFDMYHGEVQDTVARDQFEFLARHLLTAGEADGPP